MKLKHKIFAILKVAAFSAGGAIISQPDLVTALVPAVAAPYVGAGLTIAALFTRRPHDEKQKKAKPQSKSAVE